MRHVDTLVIHHSASPNGSVALFRREHLARGFADVGYHAVVGNGRGMADGQIQQGRPDEVKGSGVWGNNTGKLHVCLVGNFQKGDSGYSGPPSSKQLRTLGVWLLAKGRKFGPLAGQRFPVVVGHREITLPGHGTLCPGSEMPLHRIREWYHEAVVLGRKVGPLDQFPARPTASGVRLLQAVPVAKPDSPRPVSIEAARVDLVEDQGEPHPCRGVIIDAVTYVEVRDFCRASGLDFAYDEETRRASIRFPGHEAKQ